MRLHSLHRILVFMLLTIFVITFCGPLNVFAMPLNYNSTTQKEFFYTTINTDSETNYTIKRIDHDIELLSDGKVLFTEKIEITGEKPKIFTIGFPHIYREQLIECIAYDSTDYFLVNCDVPLGTALGFFGIEVVFPTGAPDTFNVTFLLSNDLLYTNYYGAAVLDFPAYPSLTKPVEICNVNIRINENFTNLEIFKDDGNINESFYTLENLPSLTYSPAQAIFNLIDEEIRIFNIREFTREINLNGINEIIGSDFYHIQNQSADNMLSVELTLPNGAFNIEAINQFGRKFNVTKLIDNENRYLVVFPSPLKSYGFTRLYLKYILQSQIYLGNENNQRVFNATRLVSQDLPYYVENESLTLVFPEGAEIFNFEEPLKDFQYDFTKKIFQEHLNIHIDSYYLEKIFSTDKNLEIPFSFNPLWLSFRPTLSVLFLAIFVSMTIIIWRKYESSSVLKTNVPTYLSPDKIREFVDLYEKKRKNIFDLSLLENKISKGKFSRKRYKIRRTTLDVKLKALSKRLSELELLIQSAGSKYVGLLRQLHDAESIIFENKTKIKNNKNSYEKGEISLNIYRKIRLEHQGKIDEAEASIMGILLRFREEI